jgi:predicted nucleic acid-binding Zn ribbon protein
MTFAQFVLQYLFVYFMMDMQGDFIYLVLASFGLGMVSNSVAMGLGCMLPDVKDVTELAPLIYVPQILFAGFFIRTDQIPVFLRWAQYLCSMKYAMNLVLLSEFRLDRPNCQGAEAADNCREILDSNSVQAEDFYIYIILLFVLFLVFRVTGALILVQKAKRFY